MVKCGCNCGADVRYGYTESWKCLPGGTIWFVDKDHKLRYQNAQEVAHGVDLAPKPKQQETPLGYDY